LRKQAFIIYLTIAYNLAKGTVHFLLSIVANASVDLQDVVADEPDQVGEVGHGSLVDDEPGEDKLD
jgi:hypothetical protein